MSDKLDIEIGRYIENLATKTSPITGKQIAREFNLTSDLKLRESVHRLRVYRGLIEICSDHRGYYWSEAPEDWQECMNHLDGRWIQIKQVSDKYRERLRTNVKQAELKF